MPFDDCIVMIQLQLSHQILEAKHTYFSAEPLISNKLYSANGYEQKNAISE
jgi:hypothetical protein